MSDRFCLKSFSRTFNLRRHENEYCPSRNQDTEMGSDSDSHETSSVSSLSEQSESEVDNINPWLPIIIEASEKVSTGYEELKEEYLRNGLDEETARKKAYALILPKLQKEFEHAYLDRLLWMKEMKSDPVHRKIMEIRNAFINDDGFDRQEALEAAIDKKKFLIRRLLK